MKKSWVIGILCIIILSSLSTTFVLMNRQNIYLSTPSNATCNSLSFSGDEKANLVFISSKEDAQKYSDYLFTIEPYSKDKFNIYYISNYNPTCELYQGIALLCYSKELVKASSVCPNDYTVVLNKQESKIRSSTYMNIVSINTAGPLSTLPHELGHAIAGLADEYIPATPPKNQQNCQADCSKFEKCFSGCSQSSLSRSIDSGLMKSLYAKELGQYDENLLIKSLSEKSSKITGKAIDSNSQCEKENYYLISANYSNNSIKINSKSIEIGCISNRMQGQFSYKIITKSGEIIPGSNFEAELIFTDVQQPEEEQASGGPISYEGEFLLKVPVVANSESLEISKDNINLAHININDGDARPCII